MAEDDAAELSRNVVRTLLSAHGLPVTDREVAALAAIHPGLRRRMDRIHAIDCGDLGPLGQNDPTVEVRR